ncbi:hypothetical protein CB0940_11917 [Cercospora beticola]|uniref:Uncharacterized protein n=1 Tax=Cercospora beticola TaxID=122368 RepID=A0A2G5IF00_CERBT|nr:hypothetical protein CB0940_11917 [Cercospora beticola]PIB03043.1 hypothetical protein CB0940_11917 [Cercospora beticola]WPB04278.1 hypothetical protein RHO25_008923 [Cercospora beticola]CAK1356906.1 unnamed protein product [Cercospora beticola]
MASNLQQSHATDMADHELPFPGISAVVMSVPQAGKSLSTNLSTLSLSSQTRSTTGAAPKKHLRSDEDARKSLSELFPTPKYFSEPEYFNGEALPRSSFMNKKYHSSNFATLPQRRRPSEAIDPSQENLSRTDLIKLGRSEALRILPEEYAAKYMLRHENFTIGGKVVNKGGYLFTEADFEGMQAEAMQRKGMQHSSSKRPLRDLDLRFSAIEGMTHFGACFVTNGINYPLSSREEKDAVLQIFDQQVSRDKNALSKAFAIKPQNGISPTQATDLLRHKVQRLLRDRVLTICDNTVVPCTEDDEPLVGEQNRYTRRALKEVFRLLTDENDGWLADDPLEQQLDPFRWTRSIVTIETKAGSRDMVTLAIKRRSQMLPTKTTDIFGFGLTFAESYSELRRETKVSVACKEAITQLRAKKASKDADPVVDAEDQKIAPKVHTSEPALHTGHGGPQNDGPEKALDPSSNPAISKIAESYGPEKRKRRRPAENSEQFERTAQQAPPRKNNGALVRMRSEALPRAAASSADGTSSTSNARADGYDSSRRSNNDNAAPSRLVILRFSTSAATKFEDIVDRPTANKRQRLQTYPQQAASTEETAVNDTSTSQPANSESKPPQNQLKPQPEKGKGRRAKRK